MIVVSQGALDTEMRSSSPALSTATGLAETPLRASRRERMVIGGLVAFGIALALAVILTFGRGARPHAPNLNLLFAQRPVILAHVAAALFALFIGAGLLWGPKGRAMHRLFGWTWVIAMMTVAISSFLFPVLKATSGISPIHGLSAFVAITVPLGVMAARRGDVAAHRKTMTRTFLFGLIVAGAFTLAPGRLMWRIFFG